MQRWGQSSSKGSHPSEVVRRGGMFSNCRGFRSASIRGNRFSPGCLWSFLCMRTSSSVVGMSRSRSKSSEGALELAVSVEEAVSFELEADFVMIDSW